MDFRGLIFFPPDDALCLLGLDLNISEAYLPLSPLPASQVPPYYKALKWLQFIYTGYILGAYVAPGATELDFNTLSEGYPLFALALQRLQTLYLGDYARGYTSMVGPLGPEYKLGRVGKNLYLFPFGGDPSRIQAHERR